MMVLKWVIRSYLYGLFFFQKIFQKGAFGDDKAAYLQEPYKPEANFIKDGLFKHHVKQFHESSCSVATIASVVNVFLEKSGSLNGAPVTQRDLLEKVKTAHWKERMSDNGHKGRRGLPLFMLGRVVESSLKAYDISFQFVETVQATKDLKELKIIKQILYDRLEQFETKGDCLIISHFDQGSFLPELHIPHISPVGGFDLKSKKVTLLDVDPSQVYPYQVGFDTYYKGLSYNYNPFFRMLGYAEGGYIFIQI
ncbi:MAG: phytochelatin synthase [Desulfobacteraceae bacterium]|nr:phytochelatin synthase [Desulfobacteraceae bacterium]